jgi:hypothetical protein
MKLTIKEDNKSYDINLEQITQLCGTNFRLKNYIKMSIEKHFSNTKYAEFEKYYFENVYLEDELAGRNYFEVYSVNDKADLIKYISVNKNSILNLYIKEKFNEFEYQKDMEQIEDKLSQIFIRLNEELIYKLGDIELQYETKDILQLIQDTKICGNEFTYLEQMNNFQLISIFVNLIKEMQRITPQKIIIIFNNIDHVLSVEEYKLLINRLEDLAKDSDIYAIMFTSITPFVVMNEEVIKGVNVINDEIFTFPSYDKILKFVQNNYPYNIKGEELEKNIDNLKYIIHEIGNPKYKINLKAQILVKLINETLAINTKINEKINNLEYNFLNN